MATLPTKGSRSNGQKLRLRICLLSIPRATFGNQTRSFTGRCLEEVEGKSDRKATSLNPVVGVFSTSTHGHLIVFCVAAAVLRDGKWVFRADDSYDLEKRREMAAAKAKKDAENVRAST